MATESHPVFVIGTGPAGLAAALALANAGVPVRLVERSNLVGGKVNSHRDGGFSLEHGVHGWWTNYINFDRMLRWADVDPDRALLEASGSTLILADGRQFPLRPLSINLPSPLFLAAQFLKAPYLSLIDLVRTVPFAVHMLAFDHEKDYDTYDGFSFQQLMDFCGVSPRVQRLLFDSFALSFDFTTVDRLSAAAVLSGLQFYVVRDQRSILSRWARGLPSDVMFGPIVAMLQSIGATVSMSTALQSVQIENGQVAGVRLVGPDSNDQPVAAPVVVGKVDLALVPNGGFLQVPLPSGEGWVGRFAEGIRAFGARCTHEGCTIDWNKDASAFVCPCHGGRFDPQGNVLQGPPKLPLDKLATRVDGQTLEILGAVGPDPIACSEVILATDLEAAKEVVAQTEGLPTELRHNIGHLDTTPVIVVRLWFSSDRLAGLDVESAVTPDLPFIDNFFYLNRFDPGIAPEGIVVEAQAYRAAGDFLDANDNLILAKTLTDLAVINPAFVRDDVRHFTINRHRALFTRYAPGLNDLRPSDASGTTGLSLAGDWTQAPWSVWMQERAVVSGLRAANAVLRGRGRAEVDILRLPTEGILLRITRLLCLLIRLSVLRSMPMTVPPTPAELSAHEESDHDLNGWVALVVAVCNFLPLFSPQFAGLLKLWQFPFIAVSVYFFFHTEPDVFYKYGSWLRAWFDTGTVQHRLMTIGAIVGGLAEMALAYGYVDTWITRSIFPAGLVGAGVIFYGHHHGDKALITRQHAIMAIVFIVTGFTFLGVRLVPMFASFDHAWPLLFGIEAFLFISYTEQDETLAGQAPGGTADVHDHLG